MTPSLWEPSSLAVKIMSMALCYRCRARVSAVGHAPHDGPDRLVRDAVGDGQVAQALVPEALGDLRPECGIDASATANTRQSGVAIVIGAGDDPEWIRIVHREDPVSSRGGE